MELATETSREYKLNRSIETLNRSISNMKDFPNNDKMLLASGYIAGLKNSGLLTDIEEEKLLNHYKKVIYAPPVIRPLSISRMCNNDTFEEERVLNNMVYAIHTVYGEKVITDMYDYSKVYAVFSKDFYGEFESTFKKEE